MSKRPNGGDERRSSPGATAAAKQTPARVVIRQKDASASSPGDQRIEAADTAVEIAETSMGTPAPAGTETPVTDNDSMVGSVLLGRYEITRKIGQGGMGQVYEATHKLIGKRVAVKVLLDKYAKRDQIVARLEQEARLASSIGHEHIVDITDFGTTPDGRTFVVMEFLEGESLSELLSREGPLPEQRILSVVAQVASALGAAHAKGVIHRDVKPENVFLLRRKDRDFAKVVDFGISKAMRATGSGDDDDPSSSPRLTQTGMVLGTPLYMSPEQARGDDELDHRIDIYALGVIMYELSTGRPPFLGSNYLSIISQVLNDEVTPPRELRRELSEEFEAVVLRALEKDATKRYQTTDELLADISALIDDPGRTTSRARITAPRRGKPRKGGLRILAWVAGIAVVISAVAVTIAVLLRQNDPKAGTTPPAIDAGVAIVAPPPPIDAAPPPPIPDEEIVTIHIESLPEGATIYYQGKVLGTTPVDFRAVKGNEKFELIAELDGHDDTTFTVNPLLDASAPLKVRLKKVKKGSKAVKVDKRGTGSGSAATGTDNKTGSGSSSSGTHVDDTAGGELTGNPYKRRDGGP